MEGQTASSQSYTVGPYNWSHSHMNRHAVVYHLREAAEILSNSVMATELNAKFNEAALEDAMGRIYHHLNSAWNGRHQTALEFRRRNAIDYARFRRFPKQREFAFLAVLPDDVPPRTTRSASPP